MGIERVVVNASPLIALLGIGQESLLPGLFGEVSVPQAVLRRDCGRGRAKDPNAARLASLAWAQEVTTARVPESVQGWGLGRGESRSWPSRPRRQALGQFWTTLRQGAAPAFRSPGGRHWQDSGVGETSGVDRIGA